MTDGRVRPAHAEKDVVVSVIIPVRDDAARLRLCLQALERQDFTEGGYEVIVVDNASADDPGSVAQGFSFVRILHEPRPGADRARNRAIREARGDVLAFTDSDCIPSLDWIRMGVAALRDLDNPGLVAGRIEVRAGRPESPNLAELHDLVLAFPQERCVRRSHYGATANLFTLQGVFRAVGLFRDDFGGDAEWGPRVFQSGRQVVYAEGVRVSHPARHTIAALMDRTERGARELAGWQRGHALRIAIAMAKDLVPPPDLVWRIATSPQLPGPWSRLQVFLLFLRLRYARLTTRIGFLVAGGP